MDRFYVFPLQTITHEHCVLYCYSAYFHIGVFYCENVHWNFSETLKSEKVAAILTHTFFGFIY